MGHAIRTYSDHYTVSDREKWNDQWELIDGMPYCMSPAPSIRHQQLNLALSSILAEKLKSSYCKKCKVLIPVDWQISNDTVVQPDIMVYCKPLPENRVTETPEAIFEILSPSTEKKDRNEKFSLYEAQKVKTYTLLDPVSEEIEIFKLDENEKYSKISIGTTYRYQFGNCPIEIDFQVIWDEIAS
jgi:Uma2 family endonuclease